MHPYIATTEGITITVRPVYIDGQSDAMSRKFVFAYFIRIENNGKEKVQLLRRHWFIRHSSGRLEEVEGEGVIGKQPVIAPGEYHEYNSYCILET
ncbi:MAG: Co2+/Mg2+ efflux protein ApaG, partial [Ignavibacteriales bacterium]|nr:Co2+/Mg2+ efflux protein ApaG [Ignavibacteriales bacterium]